MLCCLGLFAGYAVGSMLGGPWTSIGPALGFGLGLIGDMKLLGGRHGTHGNLGGGCCGGGHMHNEGMENDEDPVCGMSVDEKTTRYATEYEGKTYYFCSSRCKSQFEKAPEKYI